MVVERKTLMTRPPAPVAGTLGRAIAGLWRRTAADPRPRLPRGERVLVSVYDTTQNRQVLATRQAVYYQGSPRELEPWHRLGWDQIERADWDADHARVTLVHSVLYQRSNLVVPLVTDLRFLELARERITATTLLRVPLVRFGRPAGWLTARRRADGRGEVRWTLTSGVVPWTPAERAQAIGEVRVQAGL